MQKAMAREERRRQEKAGKEENEQGRAGSGMMKAPSVERTEEISEAAASVPGRLPARVETVLAAAFCRW